MLTQNYCGKYTNRKCLNPVHGTEGTYIKTDYEKEVDQKKGLIYFIHLYPFMFIYDMTDPRTQIIFI